MALVRDRRLRLRQRPGSGQRFRPGIFGQTASTTERAIGTASRSAQRQARIPATTGRSSLNICMSIWAVAPLSRMRGHGCDASGPVGVRHTPTVVAAPVTIQHRSRHPCRAELQHRFATGLCDGAAGALPAVNWAGFYAAAISSYGLGPIVSIRHGSASLEPQGSRFQPTAAGGRRRPGELSLGGAGSSWAPGRLSGASRRTLMQ